MSKVIKTSNNAPGSICARNSRETFLLASGYFLGLRRRHEYILCLIYVAGTSFELCPTSDGANSVIWVIRNDTHVGAVICRPSQVPGGQNHFSLVLEGICNVQDHNWVN